MDRIKVLDNDDHVGARLILVKRKIECDLRFKRLKKLKPNYKVMSWDEIKVFPHSLITDPDEKYFVCIGRNNLKNALLFEQKGKFVDAYLSLHLSAELILKQVLVLMKYAYKKRFQESLPKNIVGGKQEEDPFKSHDLNIIFDYLTRICREITTQHDARNFKVGIGVSHGIGKWSSQRYLVDQSDPIQNHQFQLAYFGLKNKFLPYLKFLFREGIIR